MTSMLRAGALAAVAVLAAGCAESHTTPCAGGGVCPAGLACVADAARDDLACAAAGGFVDGARCYLCVLSSCGDGVVDSGETCDDGNRVSGDGCPATCGPACGDGLVDPGEACDDRNLVGGDGCSATCASRETCGDGVVNDGEACDDGALRDGDGCSATCVAEAATWVRLFAEPPARVDTAMAYDAHRGRVVLFGGRAASGTSALGDTWEWDGLTWSLRPTPGGAPAPRSGHAMAYDATHQRVVLFGGVGRGDTWEWDGATWTARATTTTAPPPRAFAAMAYDAGRQEVVLFGGTDGTRADNGTRARDTWSWNGVGWRVRAPVRSPPARSAAAMVYDPRAGAIVMVGGITDEGPVAETWRWNGATWTPSADGPAPARHSAAIAYDTRRGRVVLFGGVAGSTRPPLADTWELDASGWTRVDSGEVPPAGTAALAYDVARGESVMLDWVGAGGLAPDAIGTWRRADGDWRPLRTPPAPRARAFAAAAYSVADQTLLMTGGAVPGTTTIRGETWLRTGTAWTEAGVGGALPLPLRGVALAADPGGGFITYGGTFGAMLFDEQWTWRDGWLHLAPGVGPPARAFAAMVLDEARGRVVLFGGLVGLAATSAVDETWEWDGQAWARAHPATTPPARFGHALTYDRERGRVVMFGGADGATWEWDGVDWTRHAPARSPSPRVGAALAYDDAHRRTLLYGGCDAADPQTGRCTGTPHDDLWQWDGATWTELAGAGAPGPRGFHTMAYDVRRGRVVLFGGTLAVGAGAGAAAALAETWEWDGATWEERTLTASPSARSGAALAVAPAGGDALLFGGATASTPGPADVLDDAWALAADGWHPRRTTPHPPARHAAAFAADPASASLLLFGGDDGAGRLADAWTWSGDRWHATTPTMAPAARSRAAVASAASGALVFGGDSGRDEGDLWRWSGGDWLRIGTTPPEPMPRAGAAMTYDARRGRVVLFGGRSFAIDQNDTWESDGASWTARAPITRPPARVDHSLAFDDARGTTLMFGGADGTTWEWDGDDWHRLQPATAPAARTFAAMAYDGALAGTVLFGGRAADGTVLDDAWLFRFDGGDRETCTSGFDGNHNRLVGCADPSCAGSCTTCGDAVCGPADDCHACPGDCGACAECGDFRCDPAESPATCPGDCGA